METLVRRCAGLDVHQSSVVACVRIIDQNGELQQCLEKFGTRVSDLLALSDWLESYQVSLVGMESTGVYWKPVYYILEANFECWLLNAQHMHNVPGRKTDMADAAWIAQLVQHGLVRPSFVPPKPIRELRELTRYRKSLTYERGREVQRLQKVLEDAGVKLADVVTDITGKSARAMLEALVEGVHDSATLSGLAKGRLRRKLPELRAALEGWFSPTHRIVVRELLAHLDYLDDAVERLSGEIEKQTAPFTLTIAHLDTIPGVNERIAQIIVAETGGDMQRFRSERELSSWAGLCPGNNESAGKHFSGRTRNGSKWLKTALTEAAHAAIRMKGTYFSALYGRLKSRRGHRKAIIAVAHAILVTAYYVMFRQQSYVELGADYFERRQETEFHKKRLIHQLERLGYEVSLCPKAA